VLGRLRLNRVLLCLAPIVKRLVGFQYAATDDLDTGIYLRVLVLERIYGDPFLMIPRSLLFHVHLREALQCFLQRPLVIRWCHLRRRLSQRLLLWGKEIAWLDGLVRDLLLDPVLQLHIALGVLLEITDDRVPFRCERQ
jgi:hypothetical protein